VFKFAVASRSVGFEIYNSGKNFKERLCRPFLVMGERWSKLGIQGEKILFGARF
jgi:hypothetical protein